MKAFPLRSLVLALFLVLLSAQVTAAQYFSINGITSSFKLNGCPDLDFYATGSVSTFGYTEMTWQLIRNGTVIDQKIQKFYGIFNSFTSVSFKRPAQAGSYTILKTSLFSNQSYPTITVYLGSNSSNICPIGSFDTANCFLMTKPANGFIWNNAFYVKPQSGTFCPKGSFDTANCYIMTKPANGFIYNNSFYIKKSSASCPASINGYPVTFDGANCYIFTAPWGTKAFEWKGTWYTSAVAICPLGGYDSANCLVASAPPGTTAFEWQGSWYTSPKWCG